MPRQARSAQTGNGPVIDCEVVRMLWTRVGLLIVLWVLGLLNGYSMGEMIHTLPVIATIMVLISLDEKPIDMASRRELAQSGRQQSEGKK